MGGFDIDDEGGQVAVQIGIYLGIDAGYIFE